MFQNLIKEQNSCLKLENQLIRENIHRINNLINDHKSQSPSLQISNDLQTLLTILEKQRAIITSLELSLDKNQSEYENLLEKSLQDARVFSNAPTFNHQLAEMVIKEEETIAQLQNEIKTKISQSAREISDIKSNNIHQNAELLQNPSYIPSRSPTLHKSGARVNELKKNKYLSPLN
jgi:hypothetical protein